MNRYSVYIKDVPDRLKKFAPDQDHLFVVWDREENKRIPFGQFSDRDKAETKAFRLNHPDADKQVKSCGALADHDPHDWAEFRCPGNGPFRDTDMARKRTDVLPGPPCVCSDSVRSAMGHCPPPGHREYDCCPVRRGDLRRNDD